MQASSDGFQSSWLTRLPTTTPTRTRLAPKTMETLPSARTISSRVSFSRSSARCSAPSDILVDDSGRRRLLRLRLLQQRQLVAVDVRAVRLAVADVGAEVVAVVL